MTNDGLHTYTWNADGKSITMDTVTATYDALDRMVEENKAGTYTQLVYSPTGQRLAYMNGSSLTKAYVPLPGGGVAIYNSAGLNNYHHMDWLGSFRLGSSPTRSVIANIAYAPFGEPYAVTGTAVPAFTGMTQDTDSNLYDFPAREYGTQGRWPSPDPAGLAAVDATNPQSWNRYVYVLNDPCALYDPLGLAPCKFNIAVYSSQLSNSQSRALQNALRSIFSTAGVGVSFNFSGSPDFSLSVVPSGTPVGYSLNGPVQAPLAAMGADPGPSGSQTLAAFNHGVLFYDRAMSFYGLSSNSQTLGAVLGRVGAHEAGHFLLNMIHNSPLLSGFGGIMDEHPDVSSANLGFSGGQAIQLQYKCKKLRPSSVGGGGGNTVGFIYDPLSGLSDFLSWIDSIPVGGGGGESVTHIIGPPIPVVD